MNFFVTQLIKIAILLSVQYSSGLLVKYKGVKVNYTRKINHFVLFFVPLYLDRGFAYPETIGLFILGAILSVLTLLIYTEPVRKRSAFIRTMFLSFDRPEDRPYTLLWLITQVAAGFLVAVPMIVLFQYYDLLPWVLLPILINGIGDGLAEPVGVRFGRHTYQVSALFTRKRYVRSLEGSACVFLTSIAVLLYFQALFSSGQLIAALLILPPVMTLAEAFSPHTWDTPFLFLAGYLTLFLISFV